jgi:hypothetical protein
LKELRANTRVPALRRLHITPFMLPSTAEGSLVLLQSIKQGACTDRGVMRPLQIPGRHFILHNSTANH